MPMTLAEIFLHIVHNYTFFYGHVYTEKFEILIQC